MTVEIQAHWLKALSSPNIDKKIVQILEWCRITSRASVFQEVPAAFQQIRPVSLKENSLFILNIFFSSGSTFTQPMSYWSIRILIHFRNSFVSLGPDQDCWFGQLALTHINPDLIRIRNSALCSSHLKFTVHNFWYKKCQLFQSLVFFLLAIKN